MNAQGCTTKAREMRTECTQITAPLLFLFLSVLAPPGLGVVCVAVRLEDDEQVVDEVLLLVRGAQRLALLVRLEVELPVVRVVRRIGVVEREA